MKLQNTETGQVLKVKAAQRPKFSNGIGGRAWDTVGRGTINGQEVKFWLEMSWGANYYFGFNNRWFKIPFYKDGTWPKEDNAGTDFNGGDFKTV